MNLSEDFVSHAKMVYKAKVHNVEQEKNGKRLKFQSRYNIKNIFILIFE